MRNFFRNFLIGRYGPDQLYYALFGGALVLCIAARITAKLALLSSILMAVGYALLVFAIFRMLSRNINARRRENDRFLKFWWPIRMKFVNLSQRRKSRKTHRFFKCPGCKNLLRVPKGKGKITITCPRCGERFTKKT